MRDKTNQKLSSFAMRSASIYVFCYYQVGLGGGGGGGGGGWQRGLEPSLHDRPS